MIRVFYGDDRIRISSEIKRLLGEEYEIFDGESLTAQDVMNICQGTSLFGEKRKILIRDLTPARKGRGESSDVEPGVDLYAEFLKYLDSPHTIVIWETNISRRKSFTEFRKKARTLEFKLRKKDPVFEIADLALRDGKEAAKRLKKIEDENDPYMFVGLLISKFLANYNFQDKETIRELSELDMLMKTSPIDPWRLIEGFLVKR